MKRERSGRYEICVICGKEWNVPKDLRLQPSGYICPHCSSKERSRDRGGAT